jgi:hypothetical protein
MSSICCRKFNNVEDQIGRTLAYYQSQKQVLQKITRVHINKKDKFHSVWIEDNSYYNLLGV